MGEIKDINGHVLNLNDDNIVIKSLGVSLADAVKQRLLPVPAHIEEQINNIAEQVAISVGTISSVVVHTATDETNEVHAEGSYDDGVLTLTLYNIKGERGKQGEQGAPGKSAYDMAVEQGYEGTLEEWLASLKGADGKDGENGHDGYTPIKGVDYFDGVNGKDGKDGTITNLEQSLNPDTTGNAPSSKAVADYVSTHGGANIKAGNNVTLEPQTDGSIKINAQLSGGTAQSASQVSYDNADGSQTNVQAKLTELDGKTKGEKYDVTFDAPQVNLKTDEGEYIGHVDNEGIHAKEFYLQNSATGEAIKVSELANQSGTDIFSLNGGKNAIKAVLENLTYSHRSLDSSNMSNHYKCFSLLHFSDIHRQEDNLLRISQFRKEYKKYITDVICTGDMQSVYPDENNFSWWFDKGLDDCLLSLGNHDVCNPTDKTLETERWYLSPDRKGQVSQDWCYNQFFKKIGEWDVNQPSGVDDITSPHYHACYYHKDYESYTQNNEEIYKIRIVVLDYNHWTEAQSSWLVDTLVSAANSGYQVIIANHYPAAASHEKMDCTFSDYLHYNTDYAHFNKTDVTDKVSSFVDGTLSGQEQKGVFICFLFGHIHHDLVGCINTDNRLLDVGVPCALGDNRAVGSSTLKGTRLYDCFNILSVETYMHILKLYRIGRNTNGCLQSCNFLCYDYKNKIIISNS